MTRRIITVLPFILFSTLFASSQPPKKVANSLLWRISGNGLPTPSYLFGTMHLTDKRIFQLGDSVYKALEKSAGVAVELNLEEAAAYFMDGMIKNELKEKKESALPESFEKYKQELAKKLNKPADKITAQDILRKKNAWMQKTTQEGEMPTFLDAYLYGVGKKQGKWVGGIEDISDQEHLLKQELTDNDIEEVLAADPMRNSNNEMLQRMVDIYAKEDLNAIEKLFLGQLSDTLQEFLLYKRNVKMARRIDSLAHIRHTFFATGVAHLPGEMGLITLLKNKGFMVEPVFSSTRKAASAYTFKEVPTEWHPVNDTVKGYQCAMPGKTFSILIPGNIEMKIHFDLFLMTGYMTMGVTTPISNITPNEMFQAMAKAMFSKGLLKDSAHIEQNGLAGREYTGIIEDGACRVQLFMQNNTVYLSSVFSSKSSGLKTPDVTRFFQSLQIEKRQVSTHQTPGSFTAENGTTVSTPYPFSLISDEVGGEDSLWQIKTYAGIDGVTGTNLILITKSVKKGYYLINDSLVLNDFLSFVQNMFTNPTLSNEIIDHRKWTFARGKSVEDPRLYIQAAHVARNNGNNILLAIGDSATLEEPLFKKFLSEVNFRKNEGAVWAERTAPDGVFSVSTPSPFETEALRDETIFLNFDSISNTTYFSGYDTLSKYIWFESDTAFWNFYTKRYSNELVVVKKEAIATGPAKSYEIWLKREGAFNTFTRSRFYVKNNVIARLVIGGEKEWLENPINNSFFNSFRFTSPSDNDYITQFRGDTLLAGLLHTDSIIRNQAFNAIEQMPVSEKTAKFISANLFRKYPSPYGNQPSTDVNEALAEKLAENGNKATISFIKNNYGALSFTNNRAKGAALLALAAMQTKESYKALGALLEKSTPLESMPTAFHQYLKDSLVLEAGILPSLLKAAQDSALTPFIARMVSRMLEEETVPAIKIKAAEPAFIRFSEKMLPEIMLTEEIRDYGIYSVLTALDLLNSPSSNIALEAYLQVPEINIKTETALKLLKKGKEIPTGTIVQIAADKKIRQYFYESLGEVELQKLFPLQYLTRSYMAEGAVYYSAEDEATPDSMSFVGEKTIEFQEKKYSFLLYKLTFGTGEDAETYLGIAGGYDPKTQDPLPIRELTGCYWDEPFHPEKTVELLKNYLKNYFSETAETSDHTEE